MNAPTSGVWASCFMKCWRDDCRSAARLAWTRWSPFSIANRRRFPKSQTDHYRVSPLLEQIDRASACARRRTDRYRSAQELLAELKRVREEPEEPDDGPSLNEATTADDWQEAKTIDMSVARSTMSSPRRNTWLALGLVIVLLVATAGTILYRRSRAGRLTPTPANGSSRTAANGKALHADERG